MPLDPFTGQEVYSGEVPEPPLPLRAIEHTPGIAAGILFNAGRGSRTMMAGGGFMDDRMLSGRTVRGRTIGSRRAAKYGAFTKTGANQLTPSISDRAFTRFGRYRGTTNGVADVLDASGARVRGAGFALRDPVFRGARVNNATLNPRALRRVSSLSVFSQAETGLYSFAGGVRAIGKTRLGPMKSLAQAVDAADGENILGAGLLSAVTAGRKTDILERKALSGSERALRKLSKVDRTVQRLAGMNNPAILQSTTSLVGGGMAGSISTVTPGLVDSSMAAAVTGKGAGQVGVRGNLLASSMGGKGTQYLAGMFRGALGHFDTPGLSPMAQRGADKVVQMLGTSLGDDALAKTALKSGFRNAGVSVTKALGTKGGAAALGLRGAALAIPGLNVLATASLVYDLGKIGGEAIKSGINLARDANKSLQGSFSKPTFGMGYKDTEVAATSRARGVMAIQNSRLNARSMLGSEAGAMAAHFG
jgi:hypothetical protein